MKTGKTLVELATEIQRRSENKKDFVVDTARMEMLAPEGQAPALLFGPHSVGVNSIGHQQIAEHAEIPAKYYERMRAEAPALLANNVNTWFAKYPAKRMVRTLDGACRSFMSDRYRPLENEQLAEAVLPVLDRLGVEIMSAEITDRKFYLKVVDRKVTQDVPTGRKIGDGSHVFFDTCSPGMVISNSEVGCGALRIETAIWTKICTNLAVVPSEGSLKKFHIGGKNEIGGEEGFAMLSDNTRRLNDAALWHTIADLVKGAFEAARFQALVSQTYIGLADQRIEGNPIETIDLAAKKFGFSEGEKNSVLKHLIQDGDLSRYGVLNAITRTAEDLADYDRASEFERIGGQVLTLPAADWKRMAHAGMEKLAA